MVKAHLGNVFKPLTSTSNELSNELWYNFDIEKEYIIGFRLD